MDRRSFLKSAPITGVMMVAGCTENTDEEIQDSDGDGVIDSHDYAPHDPEVQEKSDIQNTKKSVKTTTTDPPDTTTSTPTTTTTTTSSTPTTTTTTNKTTTLSSNSITVDRADFHEPLSHFTEYSIDSASIRVHPEGSEVGDFTTGTVWIVAYGLADGYYYGLGSTSFDISSGPKEVTAEIEWDSKSTSRQYHYGAILGPSGVAFSELTGENTEYVHETDAFSIHSDKLTISRVNPPELSSITDTSGSSYERTLREGEIALEFSGRTSGREWTVIFSIYKSAYIEAVRRDHGRSIPEFVNYEMSSGFASELAQIVASEAEYNNYTGKQEQVEFVIDFVQHLPYVPDDVSTPYDDYTKFSAETLVELGGDCEDTSVLLASILQSEPFNYDMVLISPPGHMAAGIYGADDLPGYYWEYDGRKYYYIETTGIGWGIGDLPDEYKDTSAYIYQV